jgi:hypothetical protein
MPVFRTASGSASVRVLGGVRRVVFPVATLLASFAVPAVGRSDEPVAVPPRGGTGISAAQPLARDDASRKRWDAIRADHSAWLARWTTLRFSYRSKLVEGRANTTLVVPVGTVLHHDFRLRRDGYAWSHVYEVTDTGREPRRQVRIHHPDKEFEVHYPPEDSRYDDPRELHTLAMPVRGRLFSIDCHPFDFVWMREEWFPDPFQRRNIVGLRMESVEVDGRAVERATMRSPASPSMPPAEWTTDFDPAHQHLPCGTGGSTTRGTVEEFREVLPGWSMPWKGRRILDYPPEKTYLETTWELLDVEVDPTFDKSDFEPPFGPNTLETAGPNRSPVVLPAESPSGAAPAGPEPRRTGWDPAATWGVIAAGVVALVCVATRSKKGGGGGG